MVWHKVFRWLQIALTVTRCLFVTRAGLLRTLYSLGHAGGHCLCQRAQRTREEGKAHRRANQMGATASLEPWLESSARSLVCPEVLRSSKSQAPETRQESWRRRLWRALW